MTKMRDHIVSDMSGHIANALIADFRIRAIQMYQAGVTPAEGMAISMIVAKQFVVAATGGAAILSGVEDQGMIFDELIRAVFADVMLARDQILAELGQVTAAQAR